MASRLFAGTAEAGARLGEFLPWRPQRDWSHKIELLAGRTILTNTSFHLLKQQDKQG